MRTSKEGLNLSATDFITGASSVLESSDFDYTLSIIVKFDLAILLTDVIELHALGNLVPLASFPGVSASADRITTVPQCCTR